MNSTIDLDAYLRRIGWNGALRPDLATLRSLAGAHAAAIPFENLSPLLGEPVPLDLPSLEDKLVRRGRGGYCFEHNQLFAEVLRAIGFTVSGLAARVLWNRPPDAVTARSHMLLRVELPDVPAVPHLVDVGFGGLTLTGALRLEPDVEQATPHEPFRLLQHDGDWRMQARLRGQWQTLYRFDLQRQHAVDYEVANHFVSTHPQSQFVHRLMCARSAPLQRLALLDRELTVHPRQGESERRTLSTMEELCAVLERDFLVTLPPGDALLRRLRSLFD
ncbi:MAG TPA: arylamine N-acetyltransferase [Albitalea sp.]|nr:arylamine N-acetyltransferase [Albitalea sp.]